MWKPTIAPELDNEPHRRRNKNMNNNTVYVGHIGWSPDYRKPPVSRLFDNIESPSHWKPIETAPKDGTEVIVYCPPNQHGLGHLVSICSWHEDAGWCVCELREPTLWTSLPKV